MSSIARLQDRHPPPPPFDAGDERFALESFVVDFLAAWNRHDVEGLASCWSASGDLLNTRGKLARNRDEVRQMLREEHSGPMRASRAKMKLRRLRFLGATVVQADAEMTIDNVLPPTGVALPPLALHVTFLARKEEGAWRYVSVRPYAFLSGF